MKSKIRVISGSTQSWSNKKKLMYSSVSRGVQFAGTASEVHSIHCTM